MNIQKAAQLTGLTPPTIRYYEKIGLIDQPARTEGGIRDFDETNLAQLRFVKHMRDTGMAVEALARYISLFREADEATVSERKKILQEQLLHMEAQIHYLSEQHEMLKWKIEHYDDVMLGLGVSLKETEKNDKR